jgi:hypothetical protein
LFVSLGLRIDGTLELVQEIETKEHSYGLAKDVRALWNKWNNLAAMSALSSLGSSKFFISLVPALASLESLKSKTPSRLVKFF